MVHGIQHWKYDDRLNYLGFMRLERRRVRSNLTETFKITCTCMMLTRRFLNWMTAVEEEVSKNFKKEI